MRFKMAWKNSVAIHIGFWLYLLGGGEIYFHIESPAYRQSSSPKAKITNDSFCQQLENKVKTLLSDGISSEMLEHPYFLMLWATVRESCNNMTIADKIPTENNSDGGSDWEYSSALFLCMTILTTIGYGNYSPKTEEGKIFCIIYGFVGIPICGLFLASTTNYFSNSFLHLYERQKARHHKDKRQAGILIATLIFLIPGLAIFLFVPSAVFMVLEDWNYLDAVYFSFLSLTTIGFGDIVIAQKASELLWFYRICSIIWITLGIAYWAIIIAFIMKALKSKELSKRWEKTSQAITEQAKEMRRIMERQISAPHLNSPTHDAFIALKTKAAFEFALKLTGSMGNLGAPPLEDAKSLSGEATMINSPEKSLDLLNDAGLAMKELPIIELDRHNQQPPINPPATFAKEKGAIALHNICPPRPLLYKLRNNEYSLSTDSGFDDEIIDHREVTPNSVDLPKISRQVVSLLRENSRSSLPPMLEEKHEIVLKKQGRRNLFVRCQTRPELHCGIPKSPQLEDLLTEAILILQEAEATGTKLIVPDP